MNDITAGPPLGILAPNTAPIECVPAVTNFDFLPDMGRMTPRLRAGAGSYGNENWEFDEHGLMRLRIASINDAPIKEGECKYQWPLGRRADNHPFLSDLGL